MVLLLAAVVDQLAGSRSMTQLAERFRLDLADALAGDFELFTDFLEGAAVAIDEAEAEGKHAAFAFGEGVQDVDDLFA